MYSHKALSLYPPSEDCYIVHVALLVGSTSNMFTHIILCKVLFEMIMFIQEQQLNADSFQVVMVCTPQGHPPSFTFTCTLATLSLSLLPLSCLHAHLYMPHPSKLHLLHTVKVVLSVEIKSCEYISINQKCEANLCDLDFI